MPRKQKKKYSVGVIVAIGRSMGTLDRPLAKAFERAKSRPNGTPLAKTMNFDHCKGGRLGETRRGPGFGQALEILPVACVG